MNRLLAAAASLAVVAAGLSTVSTAEASAVPTAVPAAPAAPAVPAGHRHHRRAYTPPPVHWRPCRNDFLLEAIGAQCGKVKVPLDYRHPRGRKISLAVSRLRHTSSRKKYQGIMLVNPGGPGGSGLVMSVLGYPGIIPGRASRSYDWIGFDPRGVGASTPTLSCDRSYFGYDRPRYDPTTPAVVQDWVARVRKYSRDCAGARASRLLRHVRTTDTVRDMESIRRALGQRKLNFYGFSYGTYLAQVYATLHPHRVRRFVLDSTVDPRGVWYRDNFAQDRAFQKTSAVYFDWLARHDAVFHLGTDPAAIEKQYYAELDALEASPAAGGTVGPDELADVILSAAYYVYGWEDIGFAYAAAINDDDYTGIKLMYDGGSSLGSADDNGYAMYLGTVCTDARWPTSLATWRRQNEAVAQRAPFLTWGNAWFNAPCLTWRARHSAPVHVTGRRVHVPVLMIDETLDAATPFPGSLEVRRRFPSASLIEGVGGTTHAGSLSGVACTDRAIGRYLRNGAVPRRTSGRHSDLRCPPVPQPDPQPEPTPQARPTPQERPTPQATPSAGSTFRTDASAYRRLQMVRDLIHAVVRDAQP